MRIVKKLRGSRSHEFDAYISSYRINPFAPDSPAPHFAFCRRMIRNEKKRKEKEKENADTEQDSALTVMVEAALVLKTLNEMMNEVIKRVDGPDSDEIQINDDKTVMARIESVNWVGCDKCEAWHVLPKGMDPATIPEVWTCDMATWTLTSENCCAPSPSPPPSAPSPLLSPLPQTSTPIFLSAISSPTSSSLSSPVVLQSASSTSSGESFPVGVAVGHVVTAYDDVDVKAPAAKKHKADLVNHDKRINDQTPKLATTTTTISPSNSDGAGDASSVRPLS